MRRGIARMRSGLVIKFEVRQRAGCWQALCGPVMALDPCLRIAVERLTDMVIGQMPEKTRRKIRRKLCEIPAARRLKRFELEKVRVPYHPARRDGSSH